MRIAKCETCDNTFPYSPHQRFCSACAKKRWLACVSKHYFENKEHYLAYEHEYYQANKVELNIKRKVYREKNKEEIRKTAANYRATHKEETKQRARSSYLRAHPKAKRKIKEPVPEPPVKGGEGLK
jgi:hypothetical protein